MKTTIFYFHRLHFPSSSGQTIQVIRDYFGMSQCHQVYLFYRTPAPMPPDQQQNLLREHGVTATHSFVLDWVKEGFASGYFFRQKLSRLIKSCSPGAPVVIVTRTLDHARYALALASRSKSAHIRVVIELHETAIPHLIYQQQKRVLRAFFSKKVEKKIFSRIDGIIATVAPQRDLLDRLYPDHAPTILLPNSFQPLEHDVETRKPSHSATFKIRYAGQFSDWKNTDILFRFIRHLPDHFLLELAGGKRGDETATRRRIESLSREQGVEGRIHYAGVLCPAEVPAFLRGADCLVLPLGDNLQSQLFTSPMKLFEYAASGAPIVVTAQPTTCSLVADGQEAVMVKPNDEHELADAIQKIAANPAFAARLATNAKVWVGQFSVRERVARYTAFINSLFPQP